MLSPTRGFTLIELLVVIAIVAVLAVTVILTLNPAQLLRQARDSNRINDLTNLKSAISLYLVDVPTPTLATSTNNCYAHVSSSLASCTAVRFAAGTTVITTSSQSVSSGLGWVPINFTSISGGSPIAALPIDPINNATYFYAYKADTANLTFELNADLESSKYIQGGPNDRESTDGGSSAGLFEVGSAPGLAL